MAAMTALLPGRPRLFVGCRPEILCDAAGWITAVGEDATAAASPETERVELQGTTLPGLGDAHLHLNELVRLRSGLDLRSCHSVEEALAAVAKAARGLDDSGWLVGGGWSAGWWPGGQAPHRRQLDSAAGGRPVLLTSRDEHTIWVSSAALVRAGVGAASADPPGGLIDRESGGEPSGTIREAMDIFAGVIPTLPPRRYRELLDEVLLELAGLGLCSVHTMDPPETLLALQQLREAGRLPIRVVANLPAAHLDAAAEVGIRSGFGDDRLRVFGIKAFMDGSLGSDTAEMLSGEGVAHTSDEELEQLLQRCVAAELNPCLHAIGDRAVRRALDGLERHRDAFPGWRPRIEHAQCVDRGDVSRFAAAGVIASMQPVHAVSDRELADGKWGRRTATAYAWRLLAESGARLAFGSDAPVESPDPWLGLDAATAWRSRTGWHPELSLDPAEALRAYTQGVAFAAGMERELGRMEPGFRCDLTVRGADGSAAATVVGGVVAASAGGAKGDRGPIWG